MNVIVARSDATRCQWFMIFGRRIRQDLQCQTPVILNDGPLSAYGRQRKGF